MVESDFKALDGGQIETKAPPPEVRWTEVEGFSKTK